MKRLEHKRSSQHPDAGGWLPRVPLATPAKLRPWMLEQASLTQRVISVCNKQQPFQLRVLKHDFAMPHVDERRVLGDSRHHATLVRTREVLLQRGSVPLVFAHSVVARKDLRGTWASMDGIGGQSLGSVLFADHCVEKGALHFVQLDARHPLFQKALRWCGEFAPKTLWARRAVFYRKGRPLLVTEIFLPALLSL